MVKHIVLWNFIETLSEDEKKEAAGKMKSLLEPIKELVPGAVFDPSVLPEPASIYQVPSCAIVGTDNVYNYETFELTAFDDGEKEVIYSILLLDPNITTQEGLALGDDAAKVTQLYGSDYVQEGTAWIYPAETSMLGLIIQADHVVSIEYRMETE